MLPYSVRLFGVDIIGGFVPNTPPKHMSTPLQPSGSILMPVRHFQNVRDLITLHYIKVI